jgi:hypothetical protein
MCAHHAMSRDRCEFENINVACFYLSIRHTRARGHLLLRRRLHCVCPHFAYNRCAPDTHTHTHIQAVLSCVVHPHTAHMRTIQIVLFIIWTRSTPRTAKFMHTRWVHPHNDTQTTCTVQPVRRTRRAQTGRDIWKTSPPVLHLAGRARFKCCAAGGSRVL